MTEPEPKPKENSTDTLGCVYLVVALVASTIFWGYIATVLWRWHVMAFFPSMPALSISRAIGLSAAWSALVVDLGQEPPANEKAEAMWRRFVRRNLIAPLVLLLIGWIAMRFA